MISRRQFIAGSALALPSILIPRIAFATTPHTRNRFILVILRGGMDGLAAVPPYGDKHYKSSRGSLALAEPGDDHGILDMNGFFGLHPSLPSLHELYQSKELIAIHGTAPPYSQRSHFDAQNILESGVSTPNSVRDGWLFRSLAEANAGNEHNAAMSIGASIPLVLRGATPVGSWSPDNLPQPDDDTMSRVLALYQNDQRLRATVESMLATSNMVNDLEPANNSRRFNHQYTEATARFLSHPEGPGIAVMETSGWDTHANQGSHIGSLAGRLAGFDGGARTLKDKLGSTWDRTVVLAVTEFGRTVAMNGTRGTDHGVGSAAFLFGGAVKGGQVIADWPGLAKHKRHAGRDLAPTIDQRQIFKSVLIDHLGADPGFVEHHVFPDSADKPPLAGLFRTSATA
jgi:uncharacterized protein (DUF1501 family)